MKIALISCVSKKLNHHARAEDLYVSPLFLGSLQYARDLAADKIFILSAKYGLLSLDEEIDPYNETLKSMSVSSQREWAARVLRRLAAVTDLQRDQFVFFAGLPYRKFLIPHLARYEVPLEGLGIGKQLAFYAGRRHE